PSTAEHDRAAARGADRLPLIIEGAGGAVTAQVSDRIALGERGRPETQEKKGDRRSAESRSLPLLPSLLGIEGGWSCRHQRATRSELLKAGTYHEISPLAILRDR